MIWLSPTKINSWQDCPRSVWFSDRYRPVIRDWKFGFGTALHEAFAYYLQGQVAKFDVDIEAAWDRIYDREVPIGTLFPQKFCWDSAHLMGLRMVRELIERWEAEGLQVLVHEGVPMIEVSHRYKISSQVGLSGRWDVIAWSEKYGITVIDVKSAQTYSDNWFASVSPQLGCYILLAEDYLQKPVNRVGFLEAKKNKLKSVEANFAHAPRHSDASLEQLASQMEWIADDMIADRFPAHPRMAFNSPCRMCDFQSACHEGNYDSLEKKTVRLKAVS